MTKNQKREYIRDYTKLACIIPTLLPFPCSSNNKCCPLAACPLLCSSHLTAGSLLQRSGRPGRSCSAHPLNGQTSSSFPASLAGTAEQPGFLWWVTAAQSFSIAHNTNAHFRTIPQLSGSISCSQRGDTCQIAKNAYLYTCIKTEQSCNFSHIYLYQHMTILTLQNYSRLYFSLRGKDGSLAITSVQHNKQEIKTYLLFIFSIHPNQEFTDLSE